MKNWKVYAAVLIGAAMIFYSCAKQTTESTETYTVKVSGKVERKNHTALDSVVVITENPYRRDTLRASDGSFAISFSAEGKSEATTKMTFVRPRFRDTVITVAYSPTVKEVSAGTITMSAYDPVEDNLVSGKTSYAAASLVFIGSGEKFLSIAGSGGVDVTTLTFEVRDSLGTPVDLSNQTSVGFRFISRPDPAVAFNRDTVYTNAAGRVSVLLAAGQKAGIVQVQAYAKIRRATGVADSIKSAIVSLPVYGGMADSTHFSLGTTKYNIPGAVKFNLRAPITAIVGDKFGNPAQPGTVVYFTTTGGVIQSSSTSDDNGQVNVDLITGNPIPPDGIATITAQIATGNPNGAMGSAGLASVSSGKDGAYEAEAIPQPLKAYVSASTGGGAPSKKTNAIFSRSINILFSGRTVIETADTNFVITAGTEKKIDFFVGDANGNPLAEGTSVKVSGAGLDTAGVVLSGDIDKTIPDTQDKAWTHFSLILTDKRTTNLSFGKRIALTFEVTSPNGNTKRTISGYLPPVGSDSGKTGLADTTHFTIFADRTNYPWYGDGGAPIGKIIVQLGDKNGNPVALAPVTLTTNAGRVTGSVQTDVYGRAEASLLGGLPLPPNGIGTVTATALGVNGAISKSVSFYYTGSPILTTPESAKDSIPAIVDGGYVDVPFTIMDNNGNPIAAGSKISVSVIGAAASDIVLSQDAATTTDGVRKNFKFRATDRITDGGLDGALAFMITVDGVTGKAVKTLYGTLLSANNIVVPPSVRQPAKIAFIGTSAADIYVSGVGALENSVVTYEVQDSLGQPIDKTKRTFATYSLQFFPNSTVNGGTAPRVIPGSDSTNDQGRLMASIISGTQSGTIQLVVNVSVGGRTITSQPVKITIHSGFPDQDHFSIMPVLFTVLRDDMISQKYTVAVGDTFSNPVASGTAIYFHSQAGIVATGQAGFNAYTDINGNATVPFQMVNPHAERLPFYYVPPTGSVYDPLIGGRIGYFWAYAQTQGRFNKMVIDSVLILESMLPASINGVPTSVVTLPSGGQSQPITIHIYDANGNPLPAGTKITVAADYATTADGTLKFGITGDAKATIPNNGGARFRGHGVTDFTFSVVDQTVGGAVPGQSLIVNITVQVNATTVYETSFPARVQ
ncbi:MAG: Ig-like domain-containing protein [Acidobacteriota bacterium]